VNIQSDAPEERHYAIGHIQFLLSLQGEPVLGVSKLRYLGEDFESLDIQQLAGLRAIIPQHQKRVEGFTVAEVVSWGTYSASHEGEVTKLVQDTLSTVGLSTVGSRPVSKISGGEWAKVNLARALIQQSHMLLVDEPDAALDRMARQELFELLAASNRTVVMVTHNLGLARKFSTKITALADGKIAWTKSTASLVPGDFEELF